MGSSFTLADLPTLDDLQVFLARAARIEEGTVRLIAGSGVLAVYVAVFYPQGLLDESPTVLGLRTVALRDPGEGHDEFDVVVPIPSRIGRREVAQEARQDDPTISGPVTVSLPMGVNTVTWSAISPPRGGWRPIAGTSAEVLDQAARAGIDEVASAVPDAVGEQIVRRVRSEVWSRGIPGRSEERRVGKEGR